MSATFAYHFFILCIFLIIIWFCKMRNMAAVNYQVSYQNMVYCMIVASVARLAGILGCADRIQSQNLVYISAGIYYTALMVSCIFLYELIQNISNLDEQTKRKRFMLSCIPCIIGSIVFLINPFYHLAFTIDTDFHYVKKPLFYLHDIVEASYLIPGMYTLIRKRKYLPKNFNACNIIILLLLIATEIETLTSNSDNIIMSVVVVQTLILLFSLLSYEQFWDKTHKMMNKLALYTYLDRCVEQEITSTIYMIKIVGYQYLDEMDENHNLLSDLQMALRRVETVKNMYYVGSGRIIIVIDAEDKIEESSLLDKMYKICSRNRELNGTTFSVNIDIYIMHMPEDIKSVTQLKEYLKYNQYAVQIRDMEEKVHIYRSGQLEVQKALRVKNVEDCIARAIEGKSFQVYYQPIYSIPDGEIHSAEALIRLIDPELGFIPPDEFIPIAEKNGAIMEIGLQVFESVCQFWHNENLSDLGMKYIEINLSMEQFMDDLLCYKLQEIMEKYEIPKSALNLEITETATMYEEVKLRRQMKHMSERGFLFSLDDYGTGYSNMESVIEYPLTLIKLDKSIVWSAVENEKSFITMGSLIHMFHNLGMKIVAEGVENVEQHKMLEELKCDYIQGYYYSRPLPKDEFLKYIKNFQKTS